VAYYWQEVSDKMGFQALLRLRVTTTRDGLSFGRPERLFEGRYLAATPGHGWDVAPDGRLLVIKEPNEADQHAWFEKVLSQRILVDEGGIQRLLAETAVKH
jgi:hypothetical protein